MVHPFFAVALLTGILSSFAHGTGPQGPRPGDPAASFPYPLVAVRGQEAFVKWRELQARWRQEGASAVVLGDADDLRTVAEVISSEAQSPEQILAAARDIRPTEVLLQRGKDGGEADIAVGKWPATPGRRHSLSSHLDFVTSRPKDKVYIARIPTPRSYEIPAYLRCGNWNECPPAAEHVAILKYWHERHGLEIFAVTGDVVECIVERPPASRSHALELAREQFRYCSDLVWQGTGNLSALAQLLQGSPYWYFWWD